MTPLSAGGRDCYLNGDIIWSIVEVKCFIFKIMVDIPIGVVIVEIRRKTVKALRKIKEAPLTYRDAMILIGGLSSPSKMPGYSWSISAFECQTGEKLHAIKGSVCHGCYARKGTYMYPVVKNALNRRLVALDNPRFVEAFVLVLKLTYSRMRKVENRFRWHDSGDLQNVNHLRMICEIARQCPELVFWLPTKEPQYVAEYMKVSKVPDNLTIRVSNPMIGVKFKKRPMGLPFSTVNVEEGMFRCVAPSQGGKCLDCRACWDKTVDTNYHKH